MNYKQKVGKFGEMLARNYLVKHGHKIISCNIKTSFKEIDIIAKLKNTLVFVEVRTRVSKKFGEADESVTLSKINNFNKAITFYLNNKNIDLNDIRADLISIDIDRYKKMAKIKHYKDII